MRSFSFVPSGARHIDQSLTGVLLRVKAIPNALLHLRVLLGGVDRGQPSAVAPVLCDAST
jgi:hypothetical protein